MLEKDYFDDTLGWNIKTPPNSPVLCQGCQRFWQTPFYQTSKVAITNIFIWEMRELVGKNFLTVFVSRCQDVLNYTNQTMSIEPNRMQSNCDSIIELNQYSISIVDCVRLASICQLYSIYVSVE